LNKHGSRTFTSSDESSLRLLSTHLGNMLEKARMHEVAL
jgi:hypothetical protein